MCFESTQLETSKVNCKQRKSIGTTISQLYPNKMSQKLKFPFMIHAVIYVQNAFKKKLRKNLLENNTIYYICISHVEYKKFQMLFEQNIASNVTRN